MVDTDTTLIVNQLVRLARHHAVRTVLHLDAVAGFLGAALRHVLDYRHGRLTPDDWRARITGIVPSGTMLPFGYCYDAVLAEQLDDWLDASEETFDMVLAPNLALQSPRQEASRILQKLYRRAGALLLTVVPNDLKSAGGDAADDRLTLQLLSAAFPRIRFVDLGNLALAVIKNEFLPL